MPDAEPRSLAAVVDVLAERHGGRPAVSLPDGELSHAELADLGRRAAAMLEGLGVREGDVVMARCHNGVPLLTTWLGCATMGAVFMPVNSLLTGQPMRTVVGHAAGRVMVCDADLAPEVLAQLEGLPALQAVVVAGSDAPRGTQSLDRLLAAAPDRPRGIPGDDPAAPAKLMYTSGTTGRPKGVLWSRHAEARHACRYGDELVRVDDGENTYSCLPLFHATCQGTLVGTLWRGGHITVDRTFDPFTFWSRVRAAEAVFFPYVGTILSVLARRAQRRDDGAVPVRRVMGSAAPRDLWEEIERRFDLRIEDVYGQTELAACWTRPAGERQRPGTVGRETARFAARVVGPDGTDVPVNTPGELWIRPFERLDVFDTYFRDDEGTAGSWDAQGWYRTGDSLLRDAEGDLVFLGRARDAIRRRGEMISPNEIEVAALLHPGVMEAAAVAVPAPHGVEDEIKLCLVAREGTDLDLHEVRRFVAARLPAFMSPRYLQLYDAFPKTPTTRVQKYRLREDGVSAAWDTRHARRGRQR